MDYPKIEYLDDLMPFELVERPNHIRRITVTLAKYLKIRSKEICRDNECTEGNQNCESYAYIDKRGNLLDICASDFFQGSSEPHAAIALPWSGSQKELMKQVRDDCFDME